MADKFAKYRMKFEPEVFTPVHESGEKGPALTLRSAQSIEYRKARSEGYRIATDVTDDPVLISVLAEAVGLISGWDIDAECTPINIVELVGHPDSSWIATEIAEHQLQKKVTAMMKESAAD